MKQSFVKLFTVCSLVLLTGQGCLSLGGNSGPQTTGPAGVFVSTDRGENWQSISSLPQADGVRNVSDVSVYRLIQDPQDPAGFYWLSRSHGLFYSFDNGKTWQQATGPLAQGFVYGLSVHPNDKCTIYAANATQILRTTDCARNWEQLYREEGTDRLTSIAIQSGSPHHIFALKAGGRVLKSQDGGISWTVASNVKKSSTDIFADPHNSNVLFVATKENGIYRSNDSGATWNQLTTGLERLSGANEYRRFWISPTNSGYMFYVSSYGIHKSTNNGDSWQTLELIHPPGSARIYAFGANPKNENEIYYTATINERSTFYKTVDGGTNWITKRLPSGQIPSALVVHDETPEWVYVGFTIPPKQ